MREVEKRTRVLGRMSTARSITLLEAHGVETPNDLPAQGGPDPRRQLRRRERLDDVVGGAGFERPRDRLVAPVAGDEDDRQVGQLGEGSPSGVAQATTEMAEVSLGSFGSAVDEGSATVSVIRGSGPHIPRYSPDGYVSAPIRGARFYAVLRPLAEPAGILGAFARTHLIAR